MNYDAHKRHPQTHATVEPPKSPSEERRRKESSESESEDDGIKTGKGNRRMIPPGGYEYLEEEPSVTDTQEPYLGSDESSTFSDDDGHRDCGRGGYHACPDNPANYNMRDDEDEDITVIDVINTIQEPSSRGRLLERISRQR